MTVENSVFYDVENTDFYDTRVDALEFLADLLHTGPVPADQVRTAAGVALIDTPALRAAARDLAVMYTHTPEGTLWELPPTPCHRPAASVSLKARAS